MSNTYRFSLYFSKKSRCYEKFFKTLSDVLSYIERYHGIIHDILPSEVVKFKYIIEYTDKVTQLPDFMVLYAEEDIL